MSRIFLSHSHLDKRQAVALQTWLEKQDPPLANEIFIDTDADTGLKPGAEVEKSTYKRQVALRSGHLFIVEELGILARMHDRIPDSRRHGQADPVRAPGRQRPASTPASGSTAIYSLTGCLTMTWKKMVNRGEEPVVFAGEGRLYDLREAIRGAGIAAENFVWPPPSQPDRAPYRGWEPFEELDAGVFFGRDAKTCARWTSSAACAPPASTACSSC